MATKIEWCDETWNPVTGCTPVGKGCDNCYAKRMSTRLRGRCGYDPDNPFKVTPHWSQMNKPFRWKKPKRIFVCSMGDLFHQEITWQFIDNVFNIIRDNQRHTFMILTKRPTLMKEYLEKTYTHLGFSNNINERLKNVWFGVSVSNQLEANQSIPVLLSIPGIRRFVSCEPILGHIDLQKLSYITGLGCKIIDSLRGVKWIDDIDSDRYNSSTGKLDWVIAGGETGPGARPVHPDWITSLRYQCYHANVPFFFKSWGEWSKSNIYKASRKGFVGKTTGEFQDRFGSGSIFNENQNCHFVYKVGKKITGRLIDGVEWIQFPKF
jgi:protein gp37